MPTTQILIIFPHHGLDLYCQRLFSRAFCRNRGWKSQTQKQVLALTLSGWHVKLIFCFFNILFNGMGFRINGRDFSIHLSVERLTEQNKETTERIIVPWPNSHSTLDCWTYQLPFVQPVSSLRWAWKAGRRKERNERKDDRSLTRPDERDSKKRAWRERRSGEKPFFVRVHSLCVIVISFLCLCLFHFLSLCLSPLNRWLFCQFRQELFWSVFSLLYIYSFCLDCLSFSLCHFVSVSACRFLALHASSRWLFGCCNYLAPAPRLWILPSALSGSSLVWGEA